MQQMFLFSHLLLYYTSKAHYWLICLRRQLSLGGLVGLIVYQGHWRSVWYVVLLPSVIVQAKCSLQRNNWISFLALLLLENVIRYLDHYIKIMIRNKDTNKII